MAAQKKFSTIEEQLQILRSRGMIIEDSEKAARILRMENYYKVINGGKKLFLDPASPEERYKKGTGFDEFYAVYLFDRELRNIFIRYILELENNVKSVIAHDFSKKYGHENYLKIVNFDTGSQSDQRKSHAQKIGRVADLISRLQKELASQLKKNNPMVSHYALDYGFVPLWVLINHLSLGTVSLFYAYLKQQDQNDVGRHFRLKPEEMEKILFVLSVFRNACAHDERLFSLKAVSQDLRPNSIKDTPYHSALHIPKNRSGNYMYGKNDLFAIVIIFKTMLSGPSFAQFFSLLQAAIETLRGQLKTIPLTDVLQQMGFVPNWEQIREL